MTKEELRKVYKQRRAALSIEQQDQIARCLASALVELLPNNVKYIHTFLPIARLSEINTYLIRELTDLSRPGLKWIISGADFESMQMRHYEWNQETVVEISSFGIPEPVAGIPTNHDQIDAVLVPLLAFDKLGFRLGYGKGFYDRFLQQCRPDCLTIGLSQFEVHTDPLPSDSWDIPLQYCLTPEHCHVF